MLVPLQSRKGSSLKTWCGSSVGLEYRPVTPGVASSSLVRTAHGHQKWCPFRVNTGGAAPSYTPAAPGLVCLCSSSRSRGKDTPSAGALQGASSLRSSNRFIYLPR